MRIGVEHAEHQVALEHEAPQRFGVAAALFLGTRRHGLERFAARELRREHALPTELGDHPAECGSADLPRASAGTPSVAALPSRSRALRGSAARPRRGRPSDRARAAPNRVASPSSVPALVRSASRALAMPGCWTLTATSRPSFNRPRCTCPIEALANGSGSNSPKHSASGAPSSDSTSSRTVSQGSAGPRRAARRARSRKLRADPRVRARPRSSASGRSSRRARASSRAPRPHTRPRPHRASRASRLRFELRPRQAAPGVRGGFGGRTRSRGMISGSARRLAEARFPAHRESAFAGRLAGKVPADRRRPARVAFA